MYEKPQYLTPDGFRRYSKNPLRKKKLKNDNFLKKSSSSKKKHLEKFYGLQSQKGISKESAKLIAQAIRGMLKG
jgi:hypothetical protein